MERKRREIFKFFFSSLFFFFTKLNINLLASSNSTKILTNPIFFKHHISKEHESPERIKHILNYLQKTDYVKLIEIVKQIEMLKMDKKNPYQSTYNFIKKNIQLLRFQNML